MAAAGDTCEFVYWLVVEYLGANVGIYSVTLQVWWIRLDICIHHDGLDTLLKRLLKYLLIHVGGTLILAGVQNSIFVTLVNGN